MCHFSIPGERGPPAQIPGEIGPGDTRPPAKEVPVAKIPDVRDSRRQRFPAKEIPGERVPLPVQIFPRRKRPPVPNPLAQWGPPHTKGPVERMLIHGTASMGNL